MNKAETGPISRFIRVGRIEGAEMRVGRAVLRFANGPYWRACAVLRVGVGYINAQRNIFLPSVNQNHALTTYQQTYRPPYGPTYLRTYVSTV